jgi:hypothetical protein
VQVPATITNGVFLRRTAKSFPWLLIILPVLGLLTLFALTLANRVFLSRLPVRGEFALYWERTRALIMDGESPYLEDIQSGSQGADHLFSELAVQETQFIAPIYALLPVTPFALVDDYATVSALWTSVLELVLIIAVLSTFRLVGWQPTTWMLAFYLLVALLWLPALWDLIHGSFAIIVLLLLLGVMFSIRAQRDELAGLLLALITIRPDLVILLLPLVVFWAISHRRWRLIAWLGGSLGLLTIIGIIFIPNWPLQLIWALRRISPFDFSLPLRPILSSWFPGVGNQTFFWFTLFWIVLLILEWGLVWKKGFSHFLWTLSLTVVLTVWLGNSPGMDNLLLLIFPLLLLFANWENRWGWKGRILVFVTMILAGGGIWYLQLTTVHSKFPPCLYFYLPLLMIIALYWMRWWVTRPAHLYLES